MRISFLALALISSQSILAHDLSDTTLDEVKVNASSIFIAPYHLPTVRSATKIDAPLRDIPQTVNVVPQSLLRDQAMHSLQDALKVVPGIGLSTGDGQRDQVTIRGFSALADQFIDGLRDDAMYFRDLANIEQVEILKGPAAVLYGRGSSGGLINRITKKPGIDQSEVSAQLGSWMQRRGEFDLARKADKEGHLAWRITGAVEGGNHYRDQQFLNRHALSPSVLLTFSPATQLLLQAEHLSDRRVTDLGIPSFQGRPVNIPPHVYYGAANARDVDYTHTRVGAIAFTLDHQFDSIWSLRNTGRYYDYRLDRHNTFVSSVNENTRMATFMRGDVQRHETGFFNQTELMQKHFWGGMMQQFLYGIEFGQQNKDLWTARKTIGSVNLFNPILPTLPLALAAKPIINNTSILTVASAYTQALLTFTPHWKALAGIRYDRFQQSMTEKMFGKNNLDRIDHAWSPRAGLVYQPLAGQSYYLSYSQSFQPSAEFFPLAQNNAHIAPEKTSNHEIGAKFDFFQDQLALAIAIFRLERTHMKTADPATHRLIPLGAQRSDGVELTLSGQLSPDWEIWSGYAYLNAHMVSSLAIDAREPVQGKRPTLTPMHSANLWLKKILSQGWSAALGINHVGNRFANPGNTVTLPHYTTVDTMLSYQSKRYDVQLNFFNLFNRQYIIAGHGSSPHLSLPGAPRSFQLTTRYRF
ncbi:MAG: TonB-dependent siderophore receptor [Ottowia sp.]|nr:TonB-dependent siderophore receptor [Ottowia sp.]